MNHSPVTNAGTVCSDNIRVRVVTVNSTDGELPDGKNNQFLVYERSTPTNQKNRSKQRPEKPKPIRTNKQKKKPMDNESNHHNRDVDLDERLAAAAAAGGIGDDHLHQNHHHQDDRHEEEGGGSHVERDDDGNSSSISISGNPQAHRHHHEEEEEEEECRVCRGEAEEGYVRPCLLCCFFFHLSFGNNVSHMFNLSVILSLSLLRHNNEQTEPTKYLTPNTKTNSRPLFAPCKCSGSMGKIHQDCLVSWLDVTRGDGTSVHDSFRC